MEFARYAKPFLRYLTGSLPFLICGHASQTLLDLVLIAAPVAYDLAQEDDDGEERSLLRHLSDLEETRLVFAHHHDEEASAEKERSDRYAPAQIPSFYCGVERDGERDRRRNAWEVEAVVEQEQDRRGEQHAERPPSTRQRRCADRHPQRIGKRIWWA